MHLGTSRTFAATVTGTPNTAVTWSVEEGAAGGSIDQAGVYTAPATPGDFHVVATSQEDPSKHDVATAHVVDPNAFLAPSAVTGDLVIAADSGSTAGTLARRRPISPYIFGLNNIEFGGANAATFTIWSSDMPRATLNRVGGNRSTGLNWESGYSACGNDCGYSDSANSFRHDSNMIQNVFATAGVGAPWAPRINGAAAGSFSVLVTAPILGYVAKDASGHQPIPVCPDHATPAVPSADHWNQVLAHDPAGATASPVISDGFVYTDDFVAWLDTGWPGMLASGRIQIMLDNEADIWRSTHAEILGTSTGAYLSGTTSNAMVALPFDWYATRSIDHARAIKDVSKSALVWAAGFASWDGLTQFNCGAHPNGPPCADGTDPNAAGACTATPKYDWYLDYLLDRWKAAGTAYGARLVDVLDTHWYVQGLVNGGTSVTNDNAAQTDTVINARLQATRSLWDPTYIEGRG